MKKIILTLILAFTTLLLPAQQANVDISGVWKGTLVIYGSSLDIYYTISMSDNGIMATLTVPAQGLRDFPIDNASFNGITLTLSESKMGSTFKGTYVMNAFLGNFIQNGAEIPVSLARGEIPLPNRPQTPKAPFPYKEENVTFHNPQANIDLSGTLTIPEGNGPFIAVVLISGSGYQDRNEEIMDHKPFWVIADYLSRNGIAVLRYDDRGTGKSGGSKAGNTTETLSYDAQAAADYLRQRKDISSVGVAGHSEGGVIAFMLAARDPKIDFVVSIAGSAVSGAEILLEQEKAIAKANSIPDGQIQQMMALYGKLYEMILASKANDPFLYNGLLDYLTGLSVPKDTAESMAKTLTETWMYYFIKYSPQKAISQIKVPILALNGTNDLQVISTQNLPKIEEAARKGGNTNVTIKSMQGLNHLFQHSATGNPSEYASIEETFSQEALVIIKDWILQTSSATSTPR